MECSPCGKKFTEFENYEKHLQSEEHNKNIKSEQERQNVPSLDSENSSSSVDSKHHQAIKCSICDISFDSLEHFQIHSNSTQHALKVMLKQANSNETPSSNSIVRNGEMNVIKSSAQSTTKQGILPELNDNQLLPSYGNCEVCSKIFSGPEPYKQHLESQGHKKKVALKQNAGGGMILKCEPCNKVFSGQVPYADHMSSEVHKKKLQNMQFAEKFLSGMKTSNSPVGENGIVEKEDETKLWYCKICNIQCSGMAPYQQHMGGSTHFKNERRKQNQNNFANINNGMISASSLSNSNDSKVSETVSQTVNGSYETNNLILQNDFMHSEENGLKVVSNDELEQHFKIIAPDETINFNENDKSKQTGIANSDIVKQSENQKDEEFRSIQENNENVHEDGLVKIEGGKESVLSDA